MHLVIQLACLPQNRDANDNPASSLSRPVVEPLTSIHASTLTKQLLGEGGTEFPTGPAGGLRGFLGGLGEVTVAQCSARELRLAPLVRALTQGR